MLALSEQGSLFNDDRATQHTDLELARVPAQQEE